MSNNKPVVEEIEPGIELDEQIGLLKKGWVIQRFGWVFIILVMVAGLLGFFGEGIASKKQLTVGKTDVEYEGFYRHEAEMKLALQSKEHMQTVSLEQDYAKKFRIVRFVPEPISNNTSANEIIFNFLPGNNRIVTLYLVPKEYGPIKGTLKVNGTEKFNLNHFIYP